MASAKKQIEKLKEKRIERVVLVATGMKTIGKSNDSIQYLCEYRTVRNQKVLIFDIYNEYGNFKGYNKHGFEFIVNVPIIGHDDIAGFGIQKKVEIRRIVPVDKYGKPLGNKEQCDLLAKILLEFQGGCVFIEDPTTILGSKIIPHPISGAFACNKTRDIDIVTHFQSVGSIPLKILQNLNFVRMYRQCDYMEKSKDILGHRFELFKLAELIIDYQYTSGNTRYFVHIDLDNYKIKGAAKEQFDMAVLTYLLLYPQILNRAMKEKLLTKPKYSDRMHAITGLKNKFAELYFSDSKI